MSLYMIKCISLIVLIPLFLISKKSKFFWIEIAKYNVLIEIDTLKVINKFENDSIDILIKPLDRSGNLVLEKFNKKTNSIEWSKRFCASDSIRILGKNHMEQMVYLLKEHLNV